MKYGICLYGRHYEVQRKKRSLQDFTRKEEFTCKTIVNRTHPVKRVKTIGILSDLESREVNSVFQSERVTLAMESNGHALPEV